MQLKFWYSLFFFWVALSMHAQQRDTLIRIDAQPALGFNFPCLLYLPASCSPLFQSTLLVEPNNTGVANDTMSVHDRAAEVQALRGPLGHYLAEQLRMPLLVPVFPRTAEDWKWYTHLLDRDVMKVRKGRLRRIDLQLLAMINAAREKLFQLGYATDQQVIMTGYSSAGVLANRFAALHPVWVKGYAAGGINGMALLPVPEVNGTWLNYPVGTHDYARIKGEAFDLAAFQKVKQFLYMGERDSNDAVLFDDGYSKKERRVIFKVLGRTMMPDRWMRTKELYDASGVKAEFRTYADLGHQINEEVRRDLVTFFRQVIGGQRKE